MHARGDGADVLAGGVIVGGFDGTEVPPVIADRLALGHLAGVTLFRRNVATVEQVRALGAALAATNAETPPIVSIDQEGGRVARLREGVTLLPPMRTLGAIDDPELTRRAAAVVGRELAALGINLSFAPVCDVDSNPANPIIGDRAFGSEPELVSRHVVAFVAGLRDAGVLGCAKHFPGHGDTDTDSHLELPRVPHSLERLTRVELPPFRAAIDADVASVMTAHVLFDAIEPGVPATLSRRAITGLLRESFAGPRDTVIFSDDLHMKAISERWGLEDAAALAIEAGCDGLLVCSDPDAQERIRRALAARARRDAAFEQRLGEAHGRMTRMRRRVPPRPSANDQELRAALRCPAHLATLTEIQRRAPA